jgi:hypothetical protein
MLNIICSMFGNKYSAPLGLKLSRFLSAGRCPALSYAIPLGLRIS